MKQIIYLDSSNRIVEKMAVPDGTPPLEKAGLIRVEVDQDFPLGSMYGDTKGAGAIPVTNEADYRINRRNAYPPIAEQLDMLWKSMHENILPRAEPFYSTIKGVKDLHPKTAKSIVEGTVIL